MLLEAGAAALAPVLVGRWGAEAGGSEGGCRDSHGVPGPGLAMAGDGEMQSRFVLTHPCFSLARLRARGLRR